MLKRSRVRGLLVLIGILIFAGIGYVVLHNSHAATNADINNDSKVDILDLSILASNFNQTGKTFSQGDITGDGTVNVFDFSVLAGQWGQTSGGTACTGTNVTPSTFNKTLVNNAASGTTFCLAPGTYNMTASILAKTNDKFIGTSTDKTKVVLDFIGATTATLDNNGSTTNPIYYAFYGYGGATGQQNVTIQNLTIQNCKTASHTCHALKTGWNWNISNIDVHATDVGLESGTGSICDNCYSHDNVVYGYSGDGTIQNSEVSFNGGTPDAGGSTGGSKSTHLVDLTWKNNYVHDNRGPAIWCDGCWSGSKVMIDSNRIENNTGPGIDFEITWGNCTAITCIDGVASTGFAIAQNNTLKGNASTYIGQSCSWGAQLWIQNSQGVVVTGNTVDSSNGANAMCIVDTARNDFFPIAPECVSPFSATGNTFILPNSTALIGQVGYDTAAGCPNYTSSDVSFQNNTYKLNTLTAGHWIWHTMGNSLPWTSTQWKSVGQDTNSTFTDGAGTTIEITSVNWPTKYGNCATIVPASGSVKAQLRFDITSSSACNPNNDGHYRTDWSNVGTFQAGTTTCSSIPIYFPNGTPAIGSGSWWQFAEAKTPNNPGGWAEWGLYVYNKSGGGTVFDFRMGRVTDPTTNGTSHPSLWQGGNPTSGWNTFVICSNYSTTTNGFLDLYLNGTKVWSASGVYILVESSTDLDINDYTGGSPANVEIHGAPMVGPTLGSVQQVGGWTSAP